MKTNIHFWAYPAHFHLEGEIFQKKVVQKIETHILVGFTLSQATKALRDSRGIALLYFRPRH